MRLVIAMNLSPTWLTFLRQAGFEAVRWSEVGAPTASDHEVLRWAEANDCIVSANDLDFLGHIGSDSAPRTKRCADRADLLSPTAIGPAVLRALEQTRGELDAGALISVDPQRARIRVLPLSGP